MAIRNISDKNRLPAFIIYYLIWLLLVLSALYPDKRWWALSVYAYVDELSRYIILTIAFSFPVVLLFLEESINREKDETKISSLKYIISSVIFLLGSVTLFILFRAQAFYLGDGYTLLSTLASDNPIIKQREIGESMIHLWMRDIFGNGERAALLSYQTISVTAGATLLISLILFSSKVFATHFNRFVFILIMATGGYSLLWFGYVENYSLFVLFVGLYCLIGYLAVDERISHYWIIIPLMLAIIMHVMGVTLIPSAFYIILTRPGSRKLLSRISVLTKSIICFIVLSLILIPFIYVYNNSYFFKFALVPVIQNRFTVDGYTLFSFAHMLDVLNLLILLVPISIVSFVYMITNRNKITPFSSQTVYLIILTVSCGLAVFLFDPKIGMPRDWDLFSFVGIPLMLLSVLLLFSLLKKGIITRSILVLAISINLMFLIPRVLTQTSYDMALVQFQQHISWEPLKSRSAMTMLAEHYNKRGDTTQTAYEIEKWREDYPEWRQNRIAMKMYNEGYVNEAINIYKDIINYNPIYTAAYSNLGLAYLKQKNLDSAGVYLKIAEGMNPYNHRVLANLGMYYFYKNNYPKAEELFERAFTRDTLIPTAVIGLLNVYKVQEEKDKYYEFLSRVIWYKDIPLKFSVELGEHYLNQGNFNNASRVFNDALKNKGLDSFYIKSIKEKYPQLKIE